MNAPTSLPPLPDDVIALIPMRNVVLFPHVLMPISVGRPKSTAALEHVLSEKVPIGIVLQKNQMVEDPSREDLCDMGTQADVLRYIGVNEGVHQAICRGRQRIRLLELVDGYPFLAARFVTVTETSVVSTAVEALALQLRERGAELLSLLPGVPAELAHALQSTQAPDHLADVAASLLDAEVVEKQALLENLDLGSRLQKLLEIVAHRIEVLRLSREIGERTKEQLSDQQRRHLLREQQRAIQAELGEDGDSADEVDRLDEAVGKAGMPAEVEEHARKELKRLARMSTHASEYATLSTYMEWMIELPWRLADEPPIDLDAARRTLEADHFGLERIKQRIVEFLAVRKLNPAGRAPILCFVGPPGVGKTSLGQSIAKALQRPFARVSLGGVHDEAEIRGHRRTYVGAMPGIIVQQLRKAGSRHCVMMLDEVDKLSASAHGDPSAALLEVLDPEQNVSFRDNYLGVPFDLSRVVFIATANVIDNVPLPVRDRMEVIELPGYTQEEKLQIAQRYLLKRQLELNGLSATQCQLTPQALAALVADYTREAGVRQLEREIGRVMRHVALQVAEGLRQQVIVDAGDLEKILGAARFEHEGALRSSLPGVATGLAWTPVGGDILFIEATRVPGSERLILTGQLGDVMKESAQAALTLVKSRASSLGIAASLFQASDIHVHVPAGAIPKDGPSAGVAMFMALASLLTNRAVQPDTAMTGEISLRGLVMPVGGIKDKVLAAQRAGIKRVMLPLRNRKDLNDVPAHVKEAMEFTWLNTVDEAIEAALGLGEELQFERVSTP